MTAGQREDDKPAAANVSGHVSAGNNAQTGTPSGTENEQNAPGISTDKKADDTKPA
nr:hypothetical protein [Polymorphobacter sp.]